MEENKQNNMNQYNKILDIVSRKIDLLRDNFTKSFGQLFIYNLVFVLVQFCYSHYPTLSHRFEF